MKKDWWIASSVGALAVVVGVAGAGVYVNEQVNGLNRPPAYTVAAPEPILEPARAEAAPDFTGLSSQLREAASDPRLGRFSGQIRDTSTGEIIWSQNPDRAVRPASATKILTAAAALYDLGWDDTITTDIVSGEAPGTVVIKAAGDVTLSQEQIDELATQLDGQEVDTVLVDTSIWSDKTFAPGWERIDIDAGYVAPIEPVMIEGGRIGGSHGDLPRTHTPALDVAKSLAERIGATTTGEGTAPQEALVLATTESDSLEKRLRRMMEESDNVMAEAIGREIAQKHGVDTDAASSAQLTMDILREHGFDLDGVSIVDNSGLSFDNLITPKLLDDILHAAATEEQLRPLLNTLPIAGGNGTLVDRYGQLGGAGWVRAKTGTLTETSALAGTVTSESNRVFTFAFVSNESNILDARVAMDEMATVLREF
ncbi:MAG: D-alanyl-D-alanine carboxypeptidase/D-alanyl-D-alanine-endopeptidase [Corynebacterium sp.]|nr:D-alanyl-D-alanine carboxypeptidase/D-alanyl-D-alanine-endopeptidase [Corynebacterium sp.]